MLNESPGISCHSPEGAFYVFPNVAGCIGKTTAGGRKLNTDEDLCLALLEETSASKVTLPFMEEQVKAARDFMGADFWPYGIGPNRKQLEYFLAQHHKQGLSSRLVKVEELFHPTTFETYKL